MSRLIDIKHPFEIKNIRSINEYLFILKNITRIISQKGVRHKPIGLVIPVRWSNLFNDFVVDFGSNKKRDISGIHLDNLSLHYKESTEIFNSIACILNKLKNCSNSNELFEKYNLKKNENKFFAFIVNEDKIYITGFYNRCQNNKRTGVYSSKGNMSILIDNSIEFLLNVQKYLNFALVPETFTLKKSYNNVYLEFLDELENIEFYLKEDQNLEKRITFKDYVYKKLKNNKITIKKYIKIKNKEELIDDCSILWFFIYHITLLFNHNILKNINRSNVENIIVYDNISNETIKLVSNFKIEFKKKEKVLNIPLLPVSF